MTNEEFDAIINSRSSTKGLTLADIGIIPVKREEVAAAANRNIEALRASASNVEKQAKINEATITNKLGLDPKGVLASGIDLAGGGIASAANFLSTITTAPYNSNASNLDSKLSPEAITAYNRKQVGQATAEDMAILNKPTIIYDDVDTSISKLKDNPNASGVFDVISSGAKELAGKANKNNIRGFEGFAPDVATPLEIIELSKQAREQSKNVKKNANLDQYINQRSKEEFRGDLGEDFEANYNNMTEGWDENAPGKVVESVTKLAGNIIGSGVKNPLGLAQYTSENLAQLAIGAQGTIGLAALGAFNAAYAGETYREGIVAVAEKNNGKIASDEERNTMRNYSAAVGLLEYASELTLVNSAVKSLSGVKTAAKEATKSSVLKSLGNITKESTKGFVTEGATEALQTMAEAEAKQETAKPKDVYEAFAIGGLVGTAITGGASTLGELTGSTLEKIAERKQKAEATAAERKVVEDAVASGDVTALADKTVPTYSPTKVLDAYIGIALKEDSTPEVKQENLTKASDIVNELNAQKEVLELKTNAVPTEIPAYKKAVEEYKQTLANLPAEDTVSIAMYKEEIATTEQTIKYAEENAANPEQRKLDIAALKEISNTTELSERRIKELSEINNPMIEEADLATSLKSANSKTTTSDKSTTPAVTMAINKVVKLAMAAPERISVSDLKGLAVNTNNGLTTYQRNLLSALADTKLADDKLKTTAAVRNEVLFGSKADNKGFIKKIGITQYKSVIANAVTANNEVKATKYVKMLGSFAKDHAAKAIAVERAFNRGNGTIAIKNDTTKKWEILPAGSMNQEQVADKGGYIARETKGSKEIVNAIKVESAAINAALVAMTAVRDTHFKKEVSTEIKVAEPTKVETESKVKTKEAVAKVEEEVTSAEEQYAQMAEDKAINELMDTAKEMGIEIKGKNPDEVNDLIKSKEKELAKAEEVKVESIPSEVQTPSPNNKSVDTTTEPSPRLEETPSIPAKTSTPTSNIEEENTVKEVALTSVFKKKLNVLSTSIQEMYQNKDFNRVAQFFTQGKANTLTNGMKPLVAVKDFLSSWVKGDVSIKDFLVEPNDIRDSEKAAILNFRYYLKQWVPMLESNYIIKEQNPEFHKDLMQDFLEESGLPSENVSTAIASAVYSWLILASNAPKNLTPEQVGRLHGHKDRTLINYKVYEDIKDKQGFADKTAITIGEMAYNILGLKEDSKYAPEDIKKKITAALGKHGFDLMSSPELNLITTSTYNKEAIDQAFGLGEFDANSFINNSGSGKKVEMIQLNYEGKELNTIAKDIRDINKQTRNIITRMLGNEIAAPTALSKPKKFVQDTVQGSDRTITKAQKQAMNNMNSSVNRVHGDVYNLFTLFGKEAVLDMAGSVDIEKVFVSKRNISSVEAQRDNLSKQFDSGIYLIEENRSPDELPTSIDYFIETVVYKQFRTGVLTSDLNMQSSKIHRVLFTKPEWASTINLNNVAEVNTLMLAIGMNMGVNTDATLDEDTLLTIRDNIENNPKIQDAVELIRKAITTSESKDYTVFENKDNVQAVVDAVGGNGMLGFQALIAYAKYLDAVKSNKESVEISMFVGVDGKTNGTFLSNIGLGASVDSKGKGLMDFANQGGAYSIEDNQPKHFSDFKSKKVNGIAGMDMYEGIGIQTYDRQQSNIGKVNERVYLQSQVQFNELGSYKAKEAQKLADGVYTKEDLSALKVITKEFYDPINKKVSSSLRNLVKPFVNMFSFGAGNASATSAMNDSFIATFYKNFEKLVNIKNSLTNEVEVDNANSKIKEYLEAGNKLMLAFSNNQQSFNVNAAMSDLSNFELNMNQEIALKKAFNAMVTNHTEVVGTELYKGYIKKRNELVNASNISFVIYNITKDAVTKAYIDELVAEQILASRDTKATAKTPSKKVTLSGLNGEQKIELARRIEKVTPVIHTALSITDGPNKTGNLEAGIFLSKFGTSENKSEVYSSKIYTKKDSKGKELSAYERIATSPGVLAASATTHSLDAAIMMLTATIIKHIQNNHDEGGAGVLNASTVAYYLNKHTVELTYAYAPLREAKGMVERELIGLAELLRDPKSGVTTETAKAISDELFKQFNTTKSGKPKQVLVSTKLTDLLTKLSLSANESDVIRYDFFSQLAVMDQYVSQEGAYIVPQEFRDQANIDLSIAKDNINTISTEAMAAAKYIETQVAIGTKAGFEAIINKAADLTLEEEDITTSVSEVTDNSSIESGVLEESTQTNTNVLTKGNPILPVESELETFIKDQKTDADGTFSAVNLMNYLKETLKVEDSKTAKLYSVLVSRLPKSVGNEIRVKLISNTNLLSAEAIPTSPASAWMYGNTMHILDSTHIDSNISTEMVLHELLHASIGNTMEHERVLIEENPEHKSDTLSAMRELVELMKIAKKYVKDNNITGFEAALGNEVVTFDSLDEFTSWGMTNIEFQEQVLSKITMQSSTKKATTLSGIKSFIKAITDILFSENGSSSKSIETNGLSLLVSNVAVLMKTREGTKKAGITFALNKTLMQSMAAKVKEINNYTTLDIFSALSMEPNVTGKKISIEFSNKLENILSNTVEKLLSTDGTITADAMKNQSIGAIDVWLKSMVDGKAPFAVEMGPTLVTEQERFVIEQVAAVVDMASNSAAAQTSLAMKELKALYESARKRLAPKDFFEGADWNTATADEIDVATRKYDFIFKSNTDASGKSDYLVRFAAFGMGSEQFNKLLDKESFSKDTKLAGLTVAKKVEAIMEKIIQFFTNFSTKTKQGQVENAKLAALVERLVDIQAKKKNVLLSKLPMDSVTNKLEDGVKVVAEGIRKQANNIANSEFVAKSKNGYLRAGAAIVKSTANNRVGQILDTIGILRNEMYDEKHGFIMQVVDDLKSPALFAQRLNRQIKKIEGDRQTINVNTTKDVLAAFAQGGKYITPAQSKAITSLALRGGLHNLLGTYTLDEILKLVKEKGTLKNSIIAAEAKLAKLVPNGHNYFINKTKHLASMSVNGMAKDSSGLLLNTHNIANQVGVDMKNKARVRLTDAQITEVTELLNELTPLYVIKYSDSVSKQELASVLEVENIRTGEENGIEMVLLMHKQLEVEALQRNFGGDPYSMQYAYTPDILNPHTQIATATEEEGLALIDQGYTKESLVSKDPTDKTKEDKFLYVLRDAAVQRRVSGALLVNKDAAMGSKQINTSEGVTTSYLEYNKNKLDRINAIKQRELAALYTKDAINWNPSDEKGNFLVPVVDSKGGFGNWRYMMNAETRDTVLERNNNFAQILGVQAADTLTKELIKDQNSKVVDALHEDYKANYAGSPNEFIFVGPNSKDAELRDHWDSLSYYARQKVRSTWKQEREGVWVRKSIITTVFGYRKRSVSDVFNRAPDDKTRMSQATAMAIEWVLFQHAVMNKGMNTDDAERYTAQASLKVRRAEHAWQAVVEEVKDIIVIRSGGVMVGNIFSNFSLLLANGVPWNKIVKGHYIAFRGLRAWEHDSDRLSTLETKLSIGYTLGNEAEMKREIAQLKDALARNPVRELIEAGLNPTIVDDIEINQEADIYKSGAAKKLDKLVNKINPTVRKAALIATMGRGTTMYQTLHTITRMSDFVARYTLYEYETTKAKNPLSKEEAIDSASDSFINYDLPMAPGLQYTDDMGITMFTKYFIRIQKVLLKLAKDHPARVIALIAMQDLFNTMPMVFESSVWAHLGRNPFTMGAINYPFTLDDIYTIDATLGLLTPSK